MNAMPSINAYVPPKDLYSFPPSNINYPAPAPDDSLRNPISVSSYLPPPAGPSQFPVYLGPTNPDIISMSNDNKGMMQNEDSNDNDEKNNSDMNADDMNVDNGNPDRPSDGTKLIDAPPPGFMPSKRPDTLSLPLPPYPDSPDHDHYHDHHHEHAHDHDHGPYLHEDHDHPPFHGSHSPSHHDFPFDVSDFKHVHGHDAYPEIIIHHDPHHDFHDFEHDHHHFHLPPPPPPPPPPTTEAPLPPIEEPEEPEEQPRVKKYSYFYLSRSLWYIPLYFTVWFTFYVTWLILQSIGRHKVIEHILSINFQFQMFFHFDIF